MVIATTFIYRYLFSINFLTGNWTGEVPLSCSGTPEGMRCRCLSFFFPSFFLSLRFCLFRVFFREGGSRRDTVCSCTEAVVGHATWFCSVDTLMKDTGMALVKMAAQHIKKKYKMCVMVCVGTEKTVRTCW